MGANMRDDHATFAGTFYFPLDRAGVTRDLGRPVRRSTLRQPTGDVFGRVPDDRATRRLHLEADAMQQGQGSKGEV